LKNRYVRQLQLLYAMSSSKAIEDGIEAIRYQLAQMKEEPEVWVPAEGMLVEVRDDAHNGWQPRRSAGSMTKDGLNCYQYPHDGAIYAWKYWRRIPLNFQFIPYLGTGWPKGVGSMQIHALLKSGNMMTFPKSRAITCWDQVIAYCPVEEEKNGI